MKTIHRIALLVLCQLACACALAQAPDPFVGNWKATWEAPKVGPIQADMEITPTGGSWQALFSTRNNLCAGRKIPMVFEKIEGDQATLVQKFSEVITGCPDIRLRIRKVDANNMSGVRGKDVMTFVRN